jgi:hypothetical protein
VFFAFGSKGISFVHNKAIYTEDGKNILQGMNKYTE